MSSERIGVPAPTLAVGQQLVAAARGAGAGSRSARTTPGRRSPAAAARRPWRGSRTRWRPACTVTCSRCSVASPSPPSSSAYSSLPIRNTPTSSRRTAHASTRSRVGSGSVELCRRSAVAGGAGRGRSRASSSNFARSRCSRHLAWYRYCLRPAASMPVACRWPIGSGQIHTSFQAGGIASVRTRSRISESSIGAPSSSTYENPRPRRTRRSPGPAQSERRRRRLCASVVDIAPTAGLPGGRPGKQLGILKACPQLLTHQPSPSRWPRTSWIASSATCGRHTIPRPAHRLAQHAGSARPWQAAGLRVARGGDRRRVPRRQRLRRGVARSVGRRVRRPHDRPDRAHGHEPRRARQGRRADRAPRVGRRRDRAAARGHAPRPRCDARDDRQARPRPRHR